MRCVQELHNHQHFHGVYSHENFKNFETDIDINGVKKIQNCTNPAYLIENVQEERNISRICKLVEYFEDSGFAYNAAIYNKGSSTNLVLWPRKAVNFYDDQADFQIASFEISGHLVLKSQETFDKINWKKIQKTLKSVILDEKDYLMIDDKIEKLD